MSDISDRRTDLPSRAIGVPDTGQGLFQKFEVRRTDGSSEPGGKHEGCEYFVLDTDHDPHAAAALRAYAAACEASHPLLARDLRDRYHLPAQIPLEVTISTEMVSVPILRRFDQSDPIGWLQIRRDALPPTPDWCFSIGYKAGERVSEYELHEVSITSDSEYAKVIEREQTRNAAPLPAGITPEIQRLQRRAFGIARDVAAAFETKHNDGSSSAATFRALADHLLTEPEVVRAITAWAKAIEREVDRRGGATRSAEQDGERTHARRLMAKHCSLELRCTLSAHQDEWWRLNRDREASEAEILQVLAAGLQARRVEPGRPDQATELPQAVPGRCRDLARKLRDSVEPRSWIADAWTAGMLADLLEQVANAWDRRPAAGMNFSKVKLRSTGLGPVVIAETAKWAGATWDTDGRWGFSMEAWQKFTTSLSADQPMEILTSPGVSAPKSVVYDRCIERGCQEALPCPQGKCAMGPGEQA